MNSRQLQYAIALSEIRNFSQVAEKLNISQPALSKQILSLENELGVKLFDRATTPLLVTPAGQQFIQGLFILKPYVFMLAKELFGSFCISASL